MYKVTKRLSDWAMTHRLQYGYKGKCNNLHGHNYQCEVTVVSETLNHHGMVIDFKEMKTLFDTWIQEHWDHACMVNANDNALYEFLFKEENKYYVVPENSTAEFMSKYLYDKFNEIIKTVWNNNYRPIVQQVKVWETDSSFASYSENL